MKKAASAINTCLQKKMPGLLGIHFEGPFISKEKAGAHDKKYIREISKSEIDVICSIVGGKTILTFAPEKIDKDSFRYLKKKKILLSIGHTNANYHDAILAFDRGATCTTHLFNAMTPLKSRFPGVVGAALNHETSWCSIIADGHHIDFASIKIAFRAKAKNKMLLVTDAMPPVGENCKQFNLSGKTIKVTNGKCLDNNDNLSGSSLDMASAVRNCINKVGVDKKEAFKMASTYPAEFLGLNNSIGYIKPGYIANLTVLNDDYMVSHVIIQGGIQQVDS